MTDFTVLTWQKEIPGYDWDVLKRSGNLERYIRDDARQHIAARIAESRLARETLSEPDSESDDPMRRTSAVLRLTVAVAAQDKAALLARELAEAEDRGFRKAIQAIKDNLEQFVPTMGPTAHKRAALDRLIGHVIGKWDHRPAADWRPMRTEPVGGEPLEYWFLTGDVGRTPRLRVPIRSGLPVLLGGTSEGDTVVVDEQEFDAVAWRYAGRPPHMGLAA